MKKCLLPICFIWLCGCGSTYRITRVKPPDPAPPKKEMMPGMPFYVKTAACKHQSVWLQPVYTLTLNVKVTAEEPLPDQDPEESSAQHPKPGGNQSNSAAEASPKLQFFKTKTTSNTCSFTKIVPLSVYQGKEQSIQKLQGMLSEGSTATNGLQRIREIFDAWDAIKPGTYDPMQLTDEQTVTSADVYLASNTISPDVYVDYSTVYYLNTKSPLAGSSQVSGKLADDGSLTESAAQVESKTLATFLGLLPVSDVLKTIATGALPFGIEEAVVQCASPGALKATYDFDLKIASKAIKRTHSAYVLGANSSLVKPPCALPTTEVTKATYSAYNSTVEEISAEKDSVPDSNTVKVSGTVTLPKSSDKSMPKTK